MIRDDLKCTSPDLCLFFTVELPWSFGARRPGMRKHLTPWWEGYTLLQHPNSVEIVAT